MKYDLIIIGAGAAGFTAAIFAARQNCSTCVISKDFGGQTSSTLEVENYPGVGRIEGPQLMENFYEEARAVGVALFFNGVKAIFKTGSGFNIETDSGTHYFCEALLIACGKSPKHLDIPGELEFLGRGVYYSSFKDFGDEKGKRLAVIGGGSSSLQAATSMDTRAEKIYLIHRRKEFRGETLLLDRLEKSVHIEKKLEMIPIAFTGKEHIEAIIVKNICTEKVETLAIDGVCIAVGFETQTQFLLQDVKRDSEGKILINERNETTCQGIFAAGDATTIPYQQIVISAGEGAKAAISAYHYLCKQRGKRPLRVDWGFRK